MMKCREVRETLLAADQEQVDRLKWQAAETHAKGCKECRPYLLWLQRLDEGLREQDIPPPTEDFEARVMARATGTGGVVSGWKTGAAIAAALVLGIVIGTGVERQSAQPAAQPGMAAVSQPATQTAEPRKQTVRLAFNARQSLDDVRLTIELPPNVELQAFPGRRALSWQVSLKPGENVIALPLRIIYPQPGELLAHLDDGQHRKTFRTQIPAMDKTQEPSS
ncbi:hypothetical protein RE428_08310 [Marinobacter nanhaiticus D15-8W]|uniref:Anti-sigma factor n=1 Tax=Marinobacter nanhaiticus D15-8W TaxID=626887 RepID=N6WU23_9GAMM|nr:hypothetical protein [Marinobacter nanhaiticus]ENO14547.1 anti-sigma factor [Marinobacter nanhaiticus D15-8W]BES69813.1 hypothetical protein RE428_08310 [Marinobacter nanhaiticus D15-8W]